MFQIPIQQLRGEKVILCFFFLFLGSFCFFAFFYVFLFICFLIQLLRVRTSFFVFSSCFFFILFFPFFICFLFILFFPLFSLLSRFFSSERIRECSFFLFLLFFSFLLFSYVYLFFLLSMTITRQVLQLLDQNIASVVSHNEEINTQPHKVSNRDKNNSEKAKKRKKDNGI